MIPSESGWFLLEGYGINQLGQITGVGVFYESPDHWDCQGFLLTPNQPSVPDSLPDDCAAERRSTENSSGRISD